MKRFFNFFLVLALLLSVPAGCASQSADSGSSPAPGAEGSAAQPSENAAPSGEAQADDFSEHMTISMSALQIEEGYDFQQDPFVQEFQNKFNVTFDLIPLSYANWTDRNRIWISSGDMPDVSYWDFNYPDYKSYVDQGLIKALPSDYKTKYPTLADAMSKTQLADFVASKSDGELYMVPKVVFFDMPADIITAHQLIYYRKDWAQQLGLEYDMSMTRSEFNEMMQAFIEKDPGGNGAGKTLGLVSETPKMLGIYLGSSFPYYDVFYQRDGEYVWGPAQEETLEALKIFRGAYDNGTIYKDFFTASAPSDYQQLFYSGIAGAMTYDAAFGMVWQVLKEFGKANPDLNPEDAVGNAVLMDDSGNWRGKEATNYWAASLFNPSMSDEKMHRILSLMDYTCQPEIQDFINLGFLDEDYKIENGEKVITRELDANGNFVALSDKYKSFFAWAWLAILWDNYDQNNPSIPKFSTERVREAYQIKEKGDMIARVDWEQNTYSSANYDKSKSIIVNDELCEVILKSGDLEANWREWVDSKSAIIQPALDDLNRDVLGK